MLDDEVDELRVHDAQIFDDIMFVLDDDVEKLYHHFDVLHLDDDDDNHEVVGDVVIEVDADDVVDVIDVTQQLVVVDDDELDVDDFADENELAESQ